MYHFEFDDENLVWCVIHTDSDACRATFCDYDDAKRYCKYLNGTGDM